MMSNTRHAVALGTPGEAHANTIVLGGATIVIPLEMDPDCDPLHDDEVRLWSAHGGYDRTLFASDPNVEPDIDARMMFYRFEDVPLGLYRVAVCVAGEWHDLMHNLIVARDGVFLGGKKLETEKPALQAAPPDALDTDEATEDEGDGLDAPEPRQRTFDQAMRIEDDNE
jgi:hypothetical protein